MRRRRLMIVCGLIGALALPGAESAARPGLEAPGAVAGWHVALGGFSALRDVASARVVRRSADGSDAVVGVHWAVDPQRIGGGATPARDRTAMIRIEGEHARVAGFVDDALLQAIAIADGAGDVGFAVGTAGAMARLAGERWVPIASPTTASLGAIDLASPTAGWAVGSRSTILRWDGARWSLETPPAALGHVAVIEDVAALSSELAWAVTGDGRVLARDGAGWRIESAAPRLDGLSSIAFDGAERGWAAGDGVLEYSGGTWREVPVPEGSYGGATFAGGSAYVTREGTLFRLTGTRLETVSIATAEIDPPVSLIDRLVPLAPERSALLGVGRSGDIVRAAGLAAEPLWPPLRDATSLAAASDGFGWIGGEAAMAGIVGADAGGDWRMADLEVPGLNVTDIDAPRPGVAWVAGYVRGEEDGEPTFVDRAWRWNGEGWSPVDPPPGLRFDGIAAVDQDTAFSARGDVVARWDGAAWSVIEDAPEGASFGDVDVTFAADGSDAWAAWFGGVGAVHRFGGGEWRTVGMPGEAIVTRLAMVSDDEGWALAGGEVYRFDGAAWTASVPPIDARSAVVDIAAPGSGDAWLLTDFDRRLLHWDGERWRRQAFGAIEDLAAYHRIVALRPDPAPGSPAVDVWLLGSPLTVARYRLVVPVARLALPWLDVGRR